MENEKISKYNHINDLLVKESNFLQVIKGYCENEMDSSEAIARIYMLMELVCEVNEELHDKIDELMIDSGI